MKNETFILLPPNTSNARSLQGYKQFVDAYSNSIDAKDYVFCEDQIYSGTHTKYKILHKPCGHILERSIANHFHIGSGKIKTQCQHCMISNSRMSTDEFIQTFKKRNSKWSEYEILGEYFNNNTKIKVLHKNCGNEFDIRPRELIQGNYCKFCSRQVSLGERELFDFVNELFKDRNIEVKRNVKGILDNKKLELDIFIPSLNIAIEFDGVYWHRGSNGLKRKQEKFNECLKKDIRLVVFNDFQWKNKKDIIKAKIRNILGFNNDKVIYARKCSLVYNVPSKKRNEFLNKYHLQGGDKSFFNVGLKHNNELVAIMTFSKPRRSLSGKTIELSRFASSHRIIGGFSKLLKNSLFEKGTTITTYANLDYSLGNVYEINGFQFSHMSDPCYWYFKKDLSAYYHRFTFRKNNLENMKQKGIIQFFDKDLSEEANMLENNYFRYFDLGNLVYTYTF